ncbi:hypothetical protein BLNAU_1044 [Blattamonas nauphoetae]|uniref:non-specific serine/threonine protein kinase n=1 Tax=Blattamonas nauphoetae TaxID=2049346 RepID=A0ABQ9YJZ4_9EUKA|nr:hypothetical protein BLNAU_1044 [Blattamonas nauphoetae]
MTSKLDDVTPPGYTNAKRISEGAFGQVLKVTHERSGVEYAVKVLPMLKEGDKERVSREVEMLTRFAHGRIVRLHESIDMGGHQAIVMELGHRSDLGGSAPLDEQMTSTIGEVGTFEYNSPERVMDRKGTTTPASDVWSLGVLAYRMVTGKSLFDGMHLFQMSVALHTFDESKIALTIPSSIRNVLVKMLEPNVSLRATTTALFDGGLLEGMLGAGTDLSQMKSIQLATGVREMKESLNEAKMDERTMELSMEREKLLLETQELESRLRSLQMSLARTRCRNEELKKKQELERREDLLASQASALSMKAEDNVLSKKPHMAVLQFDEKERPALSVGGDINTPGGFDKDQEWRTTLFEEPISEGVACFGIKILGIPKSDRLKDGLMFGLVDALSRRPRSDDRLGVEIPNSIALSAGTGTLCIAVPSTKQNGEKIPNCGRVREGDRVVLEVDMDARPRTAVFMINGNVALTFMSGLPPSIRFGFSMKKEGISFLNEGMCCLKRATRLRRVNEVKWNGEDLGDSEDMYMNGMRSSVLTVQTEMPSLLFTDASHFRVDENRIAWTGVARMEKDGEVTPTWSSFLLAEPISEGIVGMSFTCVMKKDQCSPLSLAVVDANEEMAMCF